MIEDEILQKIYALLFTTLKNKSPYLSGNMSDKIRLSEIGENSITIVIDPEYYDVSLYNRTGEIRFIQPKNGKKSYAKDVNEHGGFFTENKSKHFANRACKEVCDIVGSEYGAEVINELEL